MINLDLRQLRQKAFDLPITKFKEISTPQDTWNIYDNTNFSVHITDKCNADCAFCIAHLRYLNEGNVYHKPELDSFGAYLKGLDESLKLVKEIHPSVSITGGEPTISPKLPEILDVLMANDVRKKTITTNASGLYFKVGAGKTIFDKLIEYKLDYLNISRAHWDEETNARLMVMKKELATNAHIAEIIAHAKKSGIKTRLSCALLNEGVKSLTDMLKYIAWAQAIGADAVIFRQLMRFNEKKVLPGRIPVYCKVQEVDLMPLWEEMDKSTDFELVHQVLGYYYYVEVRNLKNGYPIVTEAADLNLISIQLEKYLKLFGKKTAFELVYHPNGNLCAGWNENADILTSLILP